MQYVQFEKVGNSEILVSSFGGEEPGKHSLFKLSTSEINQRRCMNLSDPNKNPGKYLIAKYEISNDVLTIWILDNEKIKSALAQKQLKGFVDSGVLASTIVDDNVSNISTFISSRKGDDCFEYFLSLRIKDCISLKILTIINLP